MLGCWVVWLVGCCWVVGLIVGLVFGWVVMFWFVGFCLVVVVCWFGWAVNMVGSPLGWFFFFFFVLRTLSVGRGLLSLLPVKENLPPKGEPINDQLANDIFFYLVAINVGILRHDLFLEDHILSYLTMCLLSVFPFWR